MKILTPNIEQVNPAVGIAFLRDKIRAPQWRLISGATERVFDEKNAGKAVDWITEMQRAGNPISVLLPRFEDGHWFLIARLPLTVPLAAINPAPQGVAAADDFTAFWRLEAPVTTSRAQQLVSTIIGKAGKPAIGEPVPLPGTVLARQQGIGLAQRYAVRRIDTSPSPGYRIVGEKLVDVRQKAQAEKLDPRLMAVPLADGLHWQPGAQPNGHILVVGGSGSGKTETLKTIAAGIHRYGVPALLLDFHGDVEAPGIPTVLLSSGSESTCGLNPLELDGASAGRAGLYDQRNAVRTMVRRACPALGHKQLNALRVALETVYVRAGIKDDDATTWQNTPPTFADLIRELSDLARDDPDQANAIAGLQAAALDLFDHPIFHRANHISVDDLLTKSMRLDLSQLEDNVRFVTTETLLQRIFRAIRARGHIPVAPVDDSERFRLFVMIDEAQILSMGGGVNILDVLAREARKFGLGMVLGTQSAANLTDDIKANAASWIALKHQEADEAKRTAPNVGVAPEDLMKLRGRGDGYFRTGSHAAMRIQVRPVN